MTLNRSLVVDFTAPLEVEKITLISPVTTGRASNLWVYTDIFPFDTWVVLAGVVVAIVMAFRIISWSGVNDFHGSESSEKFSVLNAWALSLLFLIQMGYEVILRYGLVS